MDQNSITYLAELFRQFPGIGPRQAKRFVYYLLSRDPDFLDNLVRQIKNLKEDIKQCRRCFRFFNNANYQKANETCPICLDPSRDQTTLLVIEKDIDLEAVEKAGDYRGYYFVLGGTIPILDKTPEEKIRSRQLRAAITAQAASGLKEIIIATSANTEGDNTADWLKNNLTDLVKKFSLKISLLGRGLSTGSELEYADSETIKNALSNRH